ncbi:MAG: cytochrome c biogenesis protein CcsA [Gemmatimonadaceae bacterium]
MAPTVVGAQDSTSRQQPAPSSQEVQAAERTHAVRTGDTLWDLSRTYLGDPFLWPEIYRLNTDVVEDPHWIYPGERLRLPAGSVSGTLADRAGDGAGDEAGDGTAPAGGATLFSRHGSGPGGSSGRLSLVGRTPRPLVRLGEYYAAPYVERVGGPSGAGRIVATADISGIVQISARDRLQVEDRVLVTPPRGESASAGARYLAFALGPELPGLGQVVIPTAVVRVERDGAAGEALHARVVSVYDNVRVGQGLVKFDSVTFGSDVQPAPAELDRIGAKVVWIPGDNVLPSEHQYLVLDRASRDGIKPGDQFTLLRPRSRNADGVAFPDEIIAVAQVVRVTPYATTAIVIDQAQPAIREGNSARRAPVDAVPGPRCPVRSLDWPEVMIAIAHFIAISCYVGAAALAATPFVRPVSAPVRPVVGALTAGVLAHVGALVGLAREAGTMPITGLGPALSFGALLLAASLLVVEAAARDVSLTLLAAPLAAFTTMAANLLGLHPMLEPTGARLVWLVAHVALSFLGFAAFATAAAAGTMYLAERRELKSRRFGAVFRFFPALETLDRVNHFAAVVGWLGLTLGIALAVAFSVAYGGVDTAKIVWGIAAWLGVTAVATGRLVGGWRARRAALASSVTFALVVALYLAFRVAGFGGGQFL